MSIPQLSIIIPTVGNPNVLIETLSRVEIAVKNHFIEVIVVDDSIDGRVKYVPSGFVLKKSGGTGASNARNVGLNAAKSHLLLFLDDDIWISEHNISRTLELHRERSKKAYNFYWEYPEALNRQLPQSKFGKYVLHEGLNSNAHRLKHQRSNGFTKMNGLTSQYFSIEKHWLISVGGYDSIPFAGIEDLLLFKKLTEQGIEVFLSGSDLVYQDESERIAAEKLCNRYRTGALTRRIALLRGNQEMGMTFSRVGRLKGRLGLLLHPILRGMEHVLPYGLFYRKTIHYLLFIASFQGYCLDTLPSPYAEELDN